MKISQHIKKFKSYLFLITILPLLNACYPGGVEYYSETDLVITQYDDQFDFSNNKQYFMDDSINHIVDEGKEDEVDRSYDDEILARIASNLADAGYTRITGDMEDSLLIGESDVLVSVVATSNEYSGIGYIPGGGGYWGWYPGWGWGGGYYPGYPWYPGYGWGYPYTYSYSTGSLFIEMANLKGVDAVEAEIPIAWQSSINGLLSGDDANMKMRIDRAIDQSFIQSPYLSN